MRSLAARSAVALASVTILLAGCGSDGGDAGGDGGGGQEGEDITLRFSSSSVPGDPHTEAMTVFKDAVEEATDGSVTVELFDSGSLYDQTGEQQALQRGDLDIAYAAPAWLSELVPEASIFTVPYLVPDAEVLQSALTGDIGAELFDIIVEEAGVRPLAAMYLGTRTLNLGDVGEIETPEDMEGVSLRVPDAPSWIRMGEALGAQPTPVAFNELYLALQTGTVDGQENPVVTTRNANFYEVTTQIVQTNHLVDSVWPTISESTWERLSSDQQDALQAAALEAAEFSTNEVLDQEADALEFFEEQGLEVYEPDVDAFRDAAEEEYLNDDELTGSWAPGMLEALQDLSGSAD